jgi:hypothetical protein
MTAYGERIARVEVEVQELKRSFEEHKEQTAAHFTDINKKLDALLALRNKGVGVVWLVSGLVGTGIIGGFYQLFHYLFGVK